MKIERPHFKKLTKDLIAAVDRAKGKAEELSEVIQEIEFRKKAKDKLAPTLSKAREYYAEALNKSRASGLNEADWTPEAQPDKAAKTATNPQPPEQPDAPTSELRTSTQLLLDCSPSFLGRLVGQKSLKLEFFDNSLRVNVGSKSNQSNVTALIEFNLSKGFLGSRLIISSGSHRVKYGRLSNGIGRDLKVFESFVRASKEMPSALSDLDHMLGRHKYLNRRSVVCWSEKYSEVIHAITEVLTTSCQLNGLDSHRYRAMSEWHGLVNKHNENYVEAQKENWSAFFNKLESNPLTERQVEGILKDDDFTLVVAGAGTGKTSAVVGKIGFLIENEDAKPTEILALAFARKAADEMRERVLKRTGQDVEIRTFHSLGRQIVLNVEGEVPVISDVAGDGRAMHSLIASFLAQMFEDEKLQKKIINFISFHRYPAKYLEDFNTQGKYLVYLRKHEPRTLRGEPVKSFEELLIADWLTLNGVKYSYENPYEFKTANRKKRQYKPDFYLTDYGIYLEHFGIGRDGSTAPGIDQESYNAGIKWKRELHGENGTTLIETYSWERMEGVLLSALESKLRAGGVTITPMSGTAIKELIMQRDINQQLVSLLSDFLTIFKEGQWTYDEIDRQAQNSIASDAARISTFLDIFKPIQSLYEQYLSDRQEIDFADLIVRATGYLKNGKAKTNFTRIIVDEYQDISRGRQRLIKELINQQEDVRLMCVGDDWQSIFGFTGSDIRMTTEFEAVFGDYTRVDLDRTFRFTQPILDVSARFIQKNPSQLKKKISARASTQENSIEVIFNPGAEQVDIHQCLALLDKAREKRQRMSVMLLGRYNFSEPKEWKAVAEKFSMLDVEFLTIHRSKGLEADAVVILGLDKGRFGFPGEIPNDPLKSLVLPSEETFEKAEERRVFYVAMTRAREKVICSASASSPSDFLEEIMKYPEVTIHGDAMAFGTFTCPNCSVGELNLVFPNRTSGYPWRCTLHPYCEGQAKVCNTCDSAPLIGDGYAAKCADPSCPSHQRH